jgi:uncharacterized RDD family membrane protein YckC
MSNATDSMPLAPKPDLKEASSITEKPFARYAGFWRRLLAFLLDQFAFVAIMSIVGAFVIGLMYILFTMLKTDTKVIWDIAYILPYLLYLPLLWLYRTVMESSKLQATLGKLALRIIVTDINLERIGFGRANGRFWSSLLTTQTLGIGFLIVAFTKKKQAMHDFIANTLVIRKA